MASKQEKYIILNFDQQTTLEIQNILQKQVLLLHHCQQL
jgi:hypothetical protein